MHMCWGEAARSSLIQDSPIGGDNLGGFVGRCALAVESCSSGRSARGQKPADVSPMKSRCQAVLVFTTKTELTSSKLFDRGQ